MPTYTSTLAPAPPELDALSEADLLFDLELRIVPTDSAGEIRNQPVHPSYYTETCPTNGACPSYTCRTRDTCIGS
jgi:hypothetical protein